jgi:hypothetical protein
VEAHAECARRATASEGDGGAHDARRNSRPAPSGEARRRLVSTDSLGFVTEFIVGPLAHDAHQEAVG